MTDRADHTRANANEEISSEEIPATASEETPALGPCCICEEKKETVQNLFMLPWTAPTKGKGWGCTVCDLPPDGAVAVLCDECARRNRYESETVAQSLSLVVDGFAYEKGRVDVDEWRETREPFDHDDALHESPSEEISSQRDTVTDSH